MDVDAAKQIVLDEDVAERSDAFDDFVADFVRAVIEIEAHDADLGHLPALSGRQKDLAGVEIVFAGNFHHAQHNWLVIEALHRHGHVIFMNQQASVGFGYVFAIDESVFGRVRILLEDGEEVLVINFLGNVWHGVTC